MKIRAPDDVETFTENETELDPSVKEIKKTFLEEVKEILKLPKMPSKFVVNGSDSESPEIKLQVLLKFADLCREEMIPRHIKAMETIQSKSDELQHQLAYQQKEMALLLSYKKELQESLERLENAKKLAKVRHEELSERLKEALRHLQNQCKNRTFAEKKMAQDLVNLKIQAINLRVGITETTSKMNYYKTQVEVQTDLVKKYVKPLYLDKNRVVFMKANLNNMRENIEDLVHRVKTLKNQVSQIADPEYSEDLSKI